MGVIIDTSQKMKVLSESPQSHHGSVEIVDTDANEVTHAK